MSRFKLCYCIFGVSFVKVQTTLANPTYLPGPRWASASSDGRPIPRPRRTDRQNRNFNDAASAKGRGEEEEEVVCKFLRAPPFVSSLSHIIFAPIFAKKICNQPEKGICRVFFASCCNLERRNEHVVSVEEGASKALTEILALSMTDVTACGKFLIIQT